MAETKYLDQTGLQHVLEGINTKFTKVGHKHTKADITDFAHTHDERYYTESEINTKVNAINAAISGKADSSHTHDDRYYTESEINTKLAGKSDTSHSHTSHLTTEIAASTNLNTLTTPGWYKCSASEDAATCTNCPTKVAFAMEVISNAGTTQIVYEYRDSNQKIYTRNFYYGTWGAWYRIYTEANKPTAGEIGAAASSHTHTKAQITDFPTSMPASDVYAWAKASTKPAYTKAEVGLGNVDNTADANKSVKYATSAGSASTATTADRVTNTGSGSDAVARHVWFSDSSIETARVSDDNFKYNPSGNLLTANISGNAATASSVAWGNVTGKPSSFTPSSHTHDDRYYTESEIDSKVSTLNTAISGKAASSHKHAAADITSVNASAITGVIDASHLPSYVDDVIEGYYSSSKFYKTKNSDGTYATEITGEAGKIYVNLNDNKTYRWSGSAYVVISETIALGETASTAYRGDRGKIAYDHASAHGSAFASGLYKITTNAAGHVTAATAVVKTDITGLGIPAQDTVYTHPTSSGNKHIPSGGSAGQFLKWSADGTAVWAADNNTWNALNGATATAAGTAGYVAAPAKGQQGYFLRGDATWAALTKSTVGLGNVDNTADANKSVKYATSAGSATNATYVKDSLSGGNLTITYAKDGQSSTSWLASWHGTELGCISPSNVTVGRADSATKATQDSTGQQINTTYIKGISVSGRTITITKGNNTTTTITTQDTTYAAMTNDEIDAAFKEVFGS